MSHMGYNRVGRRSHATRGFRLNPRRFSVQRLRTKFFYLFRFFSRWRSSYGHVFKSMKKSLSRSNSKRDSTSSREEVPNVCRVDYRLRSYGRSNSFYSEAISDCLEFIKRSSVSVDEEPVNQRYDDLKKRVCVNIN